MLFLDEPTSGLDSSTALTVVKGLRMLCESKGITCITTIHQPSSQIFHLFDKLLIILDGFVAYHGQAEDAGKYFAGLGHPAPADWSTPDHLMELAVQGALLPHRETFRRDFGSLPLNGGAATVYSSSRGQADNRFAANFVDQVKILAHRNWLLTKGAVYSHTLLVQYLALACLNGVLWWQLGNDEADISNRITFIFWEVATWEFFPLFAALFTFSMHEDVLKKELASDSYRLSSFFLARTAVAAPLELFWPLGYCTVAWLMSMPAPGVGPFVLFLLLQFINTLVSQALGFAISASVQPSKLMVVCIVAITICFNFTGFLVPLELVPDWISWVQHLSMTKYVYQLMMHIVFTEGQVYTCKVADGDEVSEYPDCPGRDITRADVLKFYDVDLTKEECTVVLLAMLFALYGLALAALSWRHRNAHKFWVESVPQPAARVTSKETAEQESEGEPVSTATPAPALAALELTERPAALLALEQGQGDGSAQEEEKQSELNPGPADHHIVEC